MPDYVKIRCKERLEISIGYGTSVERLRMSRDQVDEHVTNMYNMLKNTIQ
ncbi:hypothetical protein [Gottfriedia acidiceleris]|nr:hypothetical protein [Bacillus sp. AFS077874]